MTIVETRLFDAKDGTLVESADTDLQVALREYFETTVRFHGRCPIIGGPPRAGVLVEEATPTEVVTAFEGIGYDVRDVIDENGYKRVLWAEQ